MVRGMVTGDHDFEAELTREAREEAERTGEDSAATYRVKVKGGDAGTEDAPGADGYVTIERLEPKPETCQFGWYDGTQGHICRQALEHPPPHRCTLNRTCSAEFAE